MKTYVTFGYDHVHEVQGQILNKDVVAVIDHGDYNGREAAFNLFGRRWSMEYPEQYWDDSKMYYFPNGYVEINYP